jgi:hypothetical protein
VPYADVGPVKVLEGLSDEQALFLSDIFPTGYMAADFCNLKGGETVATTRVIRTCYGATSRRPARNFSKPMSATRTIRPS